MATRHGASYSQESACGKQRQRRLAALSSFIEGNEETSFGVGVEVFGLVERRDHPETGAERHT